MNMPTGGGLPVGPIGSSKSVIDQQDELKHWPDDKLIAEMQNPTGIAPQYLLFTEVSRREDVRNRYQSAQEQSGMSMAEEMIQSKTQPPPLPQQQMPPEQMQGMPPEQMQGIGAMPPGPMLQGPMPQGPMPQGPMPQGPMPPMMDTPPMPMDGGMPMPPGPQSFANGGLVKGYHRGGRVMSNHDELYPDPHSHLDSYRDEYEDIFNPGRGRKPLFGSDTEFYRDGFLPPGDREEAARNAAKFARSNTKIGIGAGDELASSIRISPLDSEEARMQLSGIGPPTDYNPGPRGAVGHRLRREQDLERFTNSIDPLTGELIPPTRVSRPKGMSEKLVEMRPDLQPDAWYMRHIGRGDIGDADYSNDRMGVNTAHPGANLPQNWNDLPLSALLRSGEAAVSDAKTGEEKTGEAGTGGAGTGEAGTGEAGTGGAGAAVVRQQGVGDHYAGLLAGSDERGEGYDDIDKLRAQLKSVYAPPKRDNAEMLLAAAGQFLGAPSVWEGGSKAAAAIAPMLGEERKAAQESRRSKFLAESTLAQMEGKRNDARSGRRANIELAQAGSRASMSELREQLSAKSKDLSAQLRSTQELAGSREEFDLLQAYGKQADRLSERISDMRKTSVTGPEILKLEGDLQQLEETISGLLKSRKGSTTRPGPSGTKR